MGFKLVKCLKSNTILTAMKVSSLAVLYATSAYAAPQAANAGDLQACCQDDSDETHQQCQAWMEETGERPNCDDGFKSVMKQCPNFCVLNPDDWSCGPYSSRGNRNKHFLPFGAQAGDFVFDATGKTYSKQNFGPITWPSDFNGQNYGYAFISGHGFVRLAQSQYSNPGDYYKYYRTLQQQQSQTNYNAMIAPYWGDFDLRKGGRMSYRIMGKSEISLLFSTYRYPKPQDNRKIKTVLVATWHKIKATTYSSGNNVQNDYEITFQVVLAQCSKGDFFISYNFGDIEQDGFMYMKADACGNGGNSWSNIGFAGKNNVWNPHSQTQIMLTKLMTLL